MPSIKKHQEKRALVKQLIEQGATKKEISEQTEIPFGSIDHYLRMWELKTRNSWGKLSLHTEEVIEKLNNGVSRNQIADEYDVALNTVDAFRLRNNLRPVSVKFNEGKEEVKELLEQGKLLKEISEKTKIPLGSLSYKIDRWGLKEIQKKARPDDLVKKEVANQLSKNVRKSHKNGNRKQHWTEGLATLRGQWVSVLEIKEELEYYVTQDIFIREMAEFMQIDPRTVTKYLKKFGLQQGQGRRGSRNKWWRGGHIKYRGSDWYSARQTVLKRDNYTCQICGITEAEYREQSGRGLSVHHIEPYYFNQENLVDNLESLCQPCHIKIELENGRFAKQIQKVQI